MKAHRASSAEDFETWRADSIAPTLNQFDVGDTRAVILVAGDDGARRLTPVETERLQGFPDNWTAQRWDEKRGKVVEQSDSARYKQAGNAVSVPVVEWIARRVAAYDRLLG